MSTLSLSSARGAHAGPRTGRFTALFEAVVAEMRARRAARSVESLSDDMLHDIGIARGQIDQAVRRGRGRG